MTAALAAGMPLNTKIYAPGRVKTHYVVEAGGRASCGGPYWCPVNASASMTGEQTMWSGFGKSVNTYFAQLIERVGAENAVRMAERLGLRWHNPVDAELAQPGRAGGWGAFTLGVADTTPLEMANAYATVAADGVYCEPLPVLSIVNNEGKQLTDVTKPRCKAAVDPNVARAAVEAMRCVTGYGSNYGNCGGWSTAPGVYGDVKRPVAGKTGTTDDTRAAWFVGFTPDLAAASFIADPDNPFHVVGDWNSWKPIKSVSMVLRDGLAGVAARGFTPPVGDIVYGKNPPPASKAPAPRRR